MTDPLRVAAAQFEMSPRDKAANLRAMATLTARAAAAGAQVVAFPELCLHGYHWMTECVDRAPLAEVAEPVDGPSTRAVAALARRHGVAIGYGLLERDGDALYNTWIVVEADGPVFHHRKLHAFEHSAIASGDRLDVFRLRGWTCGVLICYDNNLPENHRVLALKGAELIFAPHQTGGFDIERAGMGRIPLALWRDRARAPEPMREAVLGPKGRAWIHKWLPCRAYDDNAYVVFTNGVGIDGPEVRVGCSAIVDPEGIVIAETTALGDDVVVAALRRDARVGSLPSAHLASRRPSLYAKLVEPADELNARLARNRVSREQIR